MHPEERVSALEQQIAALKERERELSDFLESAQEGLHRVAADGRILWANQAELDLLGYSREEYVGRHIAEFHADAPAIADILTRLGNGERLRNYEARLRAKDGTIRHVLISSNVRFQDGRFLNTRCCTRDISERKRYEQRLAAQGEVARILANESSPEAAAPLILELIGRHCDWRAGLLWTCPEFEDQLSCAAAWDDGGTRATEAFLKACREYRFSRGVGLPGRIWESRSPAWIHDLPQDRNFPRSAVAAAHGLSSAFGFPLIAGDQVLGVMEFFADEVRSPDEDLLRMSVSLGYQIGSFLQRARMQQRLAERDATYRVLTESASEGIITINASSTILFVNQAGAKIFGYAPEELVGSPLTRLMPESSRAAYKSALERYVEAGERRLDWKAVPVVGEHRNGHEIPLEAAFGEHREGTKHLFVGLIRDVSERKRLDESMQQSAKLESLGVLAGGIAHDFNNLLTGILGNVSLALETVDPDHPAKEILNNAIEASERAADLTRQLLAYAGKGRFLVESTDISSLVRQISTLVRSSIPKHVTLRLDLEQTLPAILADPAQLQQLIMNLVINAAEAIPESRPGIVLVMTRAQNLGAEDLAAAGSAELSPGRYVAISVHDNGEGMDEERIGKIFDPFFTTKFLGRGLGLAAVQGIVRGHKGTIKVFSSPGQGTTFRVLLPAPDSEPLPAREAESQSAKESVRGTVLVVDDEEIVRNIAKASLERYGYRVVTAENGRTGADLFRQWRNNLSAVLLDMNMPVMSGEQALTEMQGIDGSVPVILSSGYSEEEAVRRFSGKGLAGFVQKPYTAAVLAEKIASVLRDFSGISS